MLSSCCCLIAQPCPTLWCHGLQHSRLPCPSSSPGAWLDSCPLSWWCHSAVLSSVTPFASCPQSPSIRVFSSEWMGSSYHVAKKSIGASVLASVFPVNIQGWFPLGLTVFHLFAVQGTLNSLLQCHSSKAPIPQRSAFFMIQLYPYMTTGETIALAIWILVGKIMSLLFNTLSRFVIAWRHSVNIYISKIGLCRTNLDFPIDFPPSISHKYALNMKYVCILHVYKAPWLCITYVPLIYITFLFLKFLF